MTLLALCWEFFKTGLFSVGGGLATLPFLFEMGNKHPDWFNVQDLTNMVAVAESTPGRRIPRFPGSRYLCLPASCGCGRRQSR